MRVDGIFLRAIKYELEGERVEKVLQISSYEVVIF